jgi:IPT/TIG domain-containing protein/galactose oxidase-like protein
MVRRRLASSPCFLLSIALSLAASWTASAQVGWRQLSPTTSPPGRTGHETAWDSARGRVVLFGGRDGSGNLVADTWEWSGSDWAFLFTATAPPPRESFAMAFDAARGVTVLFGGASSVGFLGDTWTWDGSVWTQATPASSPTARQGHAMAYDSVRQRVVLFGGMDANGFLSDTWEWDGASWTLQLPAASPPPREGHRLAFDSVRRRTVLFGGEAGCVMYTCNWLSDTWEWDGANWTPSSPPAAPQARSAFACAFDPAHGSTIVFGGFWVQGGPVFRIFHLSDTWTWSGTAWSAESPPRSPSAREGAPLAFDAAAGVGVLFGGVDAMGNALAETWIVAAAPDVASLAPATGSEAGGDRVHLDGTRFTSIGDTTVTFGGVAATVVAVEPTRMTVASPPGTGTVDVVVANSFGARTLPAAFAYASPVIAARFGNVNEGAGDRESPLLLNGSAGDVERRVVVPVGQPILLFMAAPSSRATARFVLYGWLAEPDATTLTPLPRGLGAMTLPTPFAGTVPQPRFVWNNLGHRATLGVPNLPSIPAPAVLGQRGRGSPRPVVVTLQGLVEDDGSIGTDRVSVTNAILLRVIP